LKNEDSHTDKQLQGLFQSFEPSVPPGAWDGIAGKLDRNRKRRLIFRWITAAAILVLAVLGTWMGSYKNKEYKQATELGLSGNKQQESHATGPQSNEPDQSADSYKSQHQEVEIAKTTQELKTEKSAETKAIENESPSEFVSPSQSDKEKTEAFFQEPFGLRHVPVLWPIPDAAVSVNLTKPKQFKMPVGTWMLSAGVLQQQSGNGYAINPDLSRYVHKNFLSRINQGEQSMGSTGFSLQIGYALNKRLSVFGGLQFRQLNIRQQFSFSDEVPVTLMPGNNPDKFGNYPIIGYFGNTGSVSYSGFQKNTIIEIPLGIATEFYMTPLWKVKPAVSVNSGIISGVRGNTLDYQQLQIVSQQQDWFRKVQFTAGASFGVFRQLKRNLDWGISVTGNRMITPAYVPDASVRVRNHALGVGTQLIWRID
jgi:hypothetical protein